MSRQAKMQVVNSEGPQVNTTQQAISWAFRVLDVISVPGVPLSLPHTSLPADGAGDFTQWQLVRAEYTLYTHYTVHSIYYAKREYRCCNLTPKSEKTPSH